MPWVMLSALSGWAMSTVAVGDAERAGRTPWILGMVVAEDGTHAGGRTSPPARSSSRLPRGLRSVRDLVASGNEAVWFYPRCGWEPVESLELASTGIETTILAKATHAT